MNKPGKIILGIVAVILIIAFGYACFFTVQVLTLSTSWAEAQMDLTTLYTSGKCFAEYEGETVRLCPNARDVIHKFLINSSATGRERPPEDARSLILYMERGTLRIVEDEDRYGFVAIELDGRTHYYRLSMHVDFDDFEKVFYGTAGENTPVTEIPYIQN